MAARASESARNQPSATDRRIRQCPTLTGTRSLIAHKISAETCLERQREQYHKCHRCLYRGQPIDYRPDPRLELARAAENGLPKPVDAPQRNSVDAQLGR